MGTIRVRRLAAALLIAIVGVIVGYSGQTAPAPSGADAVGSEARRGETPAATRRPPSGTEAMRLALAHLPATGSSGVYKFLQRHDLLGEVSEERVEAFLVQMREALEGAGPAQRLGAARVLIALRASAGAPDLVALSEDDEEEVRLTALAGLGRIRGEGAMLARDRLQAVCTDDGRSRPERFHAIQSLSRIDRPVDADAVARLASSSEPDPVLRLMAARTLLAHRDRRAVPVLLELLRAEGGGDSTPEDVAFVRREANDTLRAVTPAEPEEESPVGWREVAPKIERAMASSGFTYSPRPLRLRE